MTKDEYVQFAGNDLALIEEIAALAGKTGKELVEYIAGSSAQALKEVIDRNLGASCNTVITQVSGNVIQVNFRARAAASGSGRKPYQAPSKRRQSANRTSLMPTTVPSTSPNPSSASVSSTLSDAIMPYNGR